MSGWVLQAVLIAQLVGSAGMFGVIWVIQLVHYPLMRKVPTAAFGEFEAEHQRRITYVVGPLMALEGVSVLAVFFLRPSCLSFALVLVGGDDLAGPHGPRSRPLPAPRGAPGSHRGRLPLVDDGRGAGILHLFQVADLLAQG
jgi:hypothetical protein